jgi:hypothetical protein
MGSRSPAIMLPYLGLVQHLSAKPTPTATSTPETLTVPIYAGVEDATLSGTCISTYGGSDPSGLERYLLFFAPSVPAIFVPSKPEIVLYTFDVTQQIDGGSTGPISASGSGTTTLPWEYKEPLYVAKQELMTNPSTGQPLPPQLTWSACQSGLVPEKTGVPGVSAGPAGFFPFTSGGGSVPVGNSPAAFVFLVYVHLVYSSTLPPPPSGQTTTFTSTVTAGGQLAGTARVTITAS